MSSPLEIPVFERPEVDLERFLHSQGGSSVNKYLKQHTGLHNQTRRAFLDRDKSLKIRALNNIVTQAVGGVVSANSGWRRFAYAGDNQAEVRRFLSPNFVNPNNQSGEKSRMHIALGETALPRIIFRKHTTTPLETEVEGPQMTWDPSGINESVRITSPDMQPVSPGVENYANKTLAFMIARDGLYRLA